MPGLFAGVVEESGGGAIPVEYGGAVDHVADHINYTSDNNVCTVIAGTEDSTWAGMKFDSAGRVLVSVEATITHYHHGLPYDASGNVVISENAIAHYHNGLPFDSAGNLVTIAPIA